LEPLARAPRWPGQHRRGGGQAGLAQLDLVTNASGGAPVGQRTPSTRRSPVPGSASAGGQQVVAVTVQRNSALVLSMMGALRGRSVV
jgi:hypothetical protein